MEGGLVETFGALCLLAIHAELAIANEERGIVVVGVGTVGDLVVFLEEFFDPGVGD